MNAYEYLSSKATQLFETTAFSGFEIGNLIMIVIGICFIYLAIAKHYEPLLLVPIGFGVIVGNIPSVAGMSLSVYDEGTVLRYLYFGVERGVYPPLIFLGIGAMTDFSTMLSNPKLVLLGAAAQVGVFLTYLGACAWRSRRRKPVPSASSAAPTDQPRSSWHRDSLRNCSVQSPSPPTPTWRWCR